jgi:hypothetical protein
MTCTAAVAGPAIAASAPGPTPAEARAEPAKINLVGSDLPGWTQSPNVDSSSDDAASNRLAVCAGAQDPPKIDVVEVSSPYFDHGNAEIISNVTVVRDRSDALQDLAGMEGKKLLPCVQKILVPYLKTQLPKGTTATGFKIGVLAPSVLLRLPGHRGNFCESRFRRYRHRGTGQ